MSLLQILPLINIITPILCQYGGGLIKADVKFDDRNDRFDVQDLTNAANQYFENLEGSKLKFRRSGYEDLPEESRQLKSKLDRMTKTDFLTALYLAKMRNKDTETIKRKYKQWQEAWKKKYHERKNENLIGFLKKLKKSADFNAESSANHDRSLEYGRKEEGYEKNLAHIQKHEDNEEDYKKQLHKLVDYLHGAHGNDLVSRRSNPVLPLDPENELLLHHAVPFKVKIHGYLQTPKLD